MDWKGIEIIVKREAEEAVNNILYESGIKGTSVESVDNLIAVQDDPTINYFDEKILNTDPDISKITGYLPDDCDFDEKFQTIQSKIAHLSDYGLDPGNYTINSFPVKEEDWATAWQTFYKPTKIGERVVIVPVWENYQPSEDEVVVKMDPGMAFGTGTHETTQLCTRALDRYVQPSDYVYDVGCGSGILSIIAAKLGAKKVIGVDMDPVAVDAANADVKLNDLQDKIEIKKGDLLEVIPKDKKADLIVSNILAEVIIRLIQSIRSYLKNDGIFIASGIIEKYVDDVKAQLIQNNFEILEVDNQGEWYSIIAKKKEK
ncbi:50S ribosomal protein L11 methyltransferase [Pseudoramibacter sp.]|jgi:ribosomal protein L11 methyltransferase|uniref:50S ribosomal protein L11 methyltransferase n=1 Tax=Pseudoramibacter sp. TaxID=2034862 RepID=UPI0025CB84E8|nr:50S ribosomal protein L11 methyltransferase [Pseudoramibacter sp.]MCH4072959.1 50S ribosomal protein L11 methyltransferase [Pseudoramibacter sp.]MCH4106730.1 50S ribosomal protein L11 methyltransferase [Pseudoramibacter sp.]